MGIHKSVDISTDKNVDIPWDLILSKKLELLLDSLIVQSCIPTVVLLELLWLIAFKILTYFGHGHMYYVYRCKSVCGPLAAGFSSSPPLMQRTADL